jgi:EpsI family protein
MPGWTFHDLPMQLGNWRGEATELDPVIAAATGASIIVNRAYRNDQGRTVALHAAMFDDPIDGVMHTPQNCYRANGWTKLDETHEDLQVSADQTFAVELTNWKKGDEKAIVLFWYQLGEQVLYSRLDLGKIRWKMRGQPKWPVLTKVMVQITITDPEDSLTTVLDFAEQVAKWLNQPEHQKYLAKWPGV